MNRAIQYQDGNFRSQLNSQGSKLRMMQGNAGIEYRNRYEMLQNNLMDSNKTPIPERMHSLMEGSRAY